MCKSSYREFLKLCDRIDSQLSEPEVLALYYLLGNLRKTKFKNIKEVSIVKGEVFGAFFHKEATQKENNIDSATSEFTRDKVSFRFWSLLSHDNLLLTQHQKHYIGSKLLEYDKARSDLDLHAYLGKEGDHLYLVFCECCASALFRVLQSIASGLNPAGSDSHGQVAEPSDGYICHNIQAEFCIAAAILQLFLYPSIPQTAVTLLSIFQSIPNLLSTTHLKVLESVILNYPKEELLWSLRYKLFVIYWSVAKIRSRRKGSGYFWVTHYTRDIDLILKPSKNLFKNCKLIESELTLSHIALQKNPTSNRVTRYWSNLYNYTRNVLNKHERYLVGKYFSGCRVRGRLLKLGSAAVPTRYKIQLLNTRAIANYYISASLKLAQISGHPGMVQIIQRVLDDAKRVLDCSPLAMRIIGFCNANIAKDRHNCWIENKTQILLWAINNLNRHNIGSKFEWILNEHLRTWQSFMDPRAIVRHWGSLKGDYNLTDYEIGKSEVQKIYEYAENNSDDCSQILRHTVKAFTSNELDRILNSFKQLLNIIYTWLDRVLYLKADSVIHTRKFKALMEIVSGMLSGTPKKSTPLKSGGSVDRAYRLLKSSIFLAYLECSLYAMPTLVSIYKLLLRINKTTTAPLRSVTNMAQH